MLGLGWLKPPKLPISGVNVRKTADLSWKAFIAILTVVSTLTTIVVYRQNILEAFGWRPASYGIYSGDYLRDDATIYTDQHVVFSLRGGHPGSKDMVGMFGTHCTWSLGQNDESNALQGRECSISSDSILAAAQKLLAEQPPNTDLHAPFWLGVKATDASDAPIRNHDVSGDTQIPRLTLRFDTKIISDKPVGNAPVLSTAPRQAAAMDIARAHHTPLPVQPDQTAPMASSGPDVLIQNTFNDKLKSSPAITKALGPLKLVLTGETTGGLIGVGVSRCTIDAKVLSLDGAEIVFRRDFVGESTSSLPIKDSVLIGAACKQAVEQVLQELRDRS